MRISLTLVKRRMRMVAVSLAAVGMVFGNLASVAAAQLDGVSVVLSDPRPSQTSVEYTFDMTSGASATVAECVQIVLNTQSDGGGTVPTGLVTTSATLDTGNTDALTGGSWTADVTVNGTLELIDGTEALTTPGDIVWDGITNSSTTGTAFFAIIDTYENNDCATNPIDTAVAAFIYKDGELVSLTIPPTLSFTCTGVASGQTVMPTKDPGSLATTVASTASGIDHGETVTAATNGISAHDLGVTTNASNGYNVYVRHTGLLENAATDTIDNWTGTNAAPTAFPAPGTEAWAYTTDDVDIAAFVDVDDWAGFPTAVGTGGDLVVTNSGPVTGGETVRVGHQVGVASTTEAGTYTTTIIYTIVATF